MSLLALRANRFDEAMDHLNGITGNAAGHLSVSLLRSDILAARGKQKESIAILEELDAVNPGRYAVVERRLEHLQSARNFREAQDIVNRYLRDVDSPDPRAWRELAEIRQQIGDSAGSHEALAHYFDELDELERARGQLELALRHVPTASQDELRLRASLKSIKRRLGVRG